MREEKVVRIFGHAFTNFFRTQYRTATGTSRFIVQPVACGKHGKPGVVCVCVFFFPFGFLLQGSGNVGMATPQKLGCILDTVRVVNFVWLQSIHRLQTAAPSTSSTPMTSRCCRCRRALDPCGDHRAACAKEAARVTTNTRIIDLSIHHADTQDDRRIEVIATGLPLWGGAHLAIDMPFVSSPTRTGHQCMHACGAEAQLEGTR